MGHSRSFLQSCFSADDLHNGQLALKLYTSIYTHLYPFLIAILLMQVDGTDLPFLIALHTSANSSGRICVDLGCRKFDVLFGLYNTTLRHTHVKYR